MSSFATSIRRGKQARHISVAAPSKLARAIANAYGFEPPPLILNWSPEVPKLTGDEATFLNAWLRQRIRELQQ